MLAVKQPIERLAVPVESYHHPSSECPSNVLHRPRHDPITAAQLESCHDGLADAAGGGEVELPPPAALSKCPNRTPEADPVHAKIMVCVAYPPVDWRQRSPNS